ncbi:uncharacterized protein LOC132641104 [Lycium barbarum]|uniref:uncharacterized protein LOC132641104 n=1 Tax=Lycium barbarum TaxID=112863 RepID=UPI00293E4D74|nr:uncharacterized protein LOC132641104 [Lycium barbarum]
MDQLQPQQPAQVYPNNPNNFPNQPNNIPMTQSSSSHNSNGSFVSVFVVLAIVLVISLIACVVGRLCSKKSHGPKVQKSQGHPQKQKEGKKNKHNEFHNKREGGDIEFGFDKRIASSKVAAAHGDHYKGSKPFKNSGGKGGVRFSDNHIDFKLGP